jgi:hypothetical protein
MGAVSIQMITAPSASHAAQMGSSPQPTTGPGLPQVLLGCVGSTQAPCGQCPRREE